MLATASAIPKEKNKSLVYLKYCFSPSSPKSSTDISRASVILLCVFYDIQYLLKKILRRESLDPCDTISDTFHHTGASMVISSCFTYGMVVENTSESLINSENLYLSPAHFRVRKIIFRYLNFFFKLLCPCCWHFCGYSFSHTDD